MLQSSQIHSRKLTRDVGKRRSSGKGYIVVPQDEDRDKYVRVCLSRGELSIMLEDGGVVENVPTSKELFNHVEFPNSFEEIGSEVQWVSEKPSNQIRVIGIFTRDDEYNNSKEGVSNIYRINGDNYVEVSVNGNDTMVNIISVSNDSKPSKVNIIANSNTEDSEINLKTTGKVNIESVSDVNVITQSLFKVLIEDKEEENRTSIEYEKGVGLKYLDEFENEIIANEDHVKVKASKAVVLGEGKEPLVLGDTLKSTLEDIVRAINKITVPTGLGPSGTPINAAEFTSIQSSLESILSQYSTTD